MELYKWYKGTELPDRECDCVVVYWSKGSPKNVKRELGHVCFDSLTKRLRIACPDRSLNDWGNTIVTETRLIRYMPIEFPKEVS